MPSLLTPILRWLRTIFFGLLAEAATVVTIILIVMTNRYGFSPGLSEREYATFAARTGEIAGMIGGTVYTFLFARLLMRRLGGQFVAHGIVVALAAVAFSIGGSLVGHRALPAMYVLASALKVAAGALAGYFAAARLEARPISS